MQICNRCVMTDHGDPTIHFDDNGICNYCTDAFEKKKTVYFPGDEGNEKISKMIEILKKDGEGREYDCLMGISGGLDSSYLAYLGAAKWGMRIAALHIDDGYDTEISTCNINLLCEKCGIKLFTIKPDLLQYNDLVKSYIKAGVPDLSVPQDNLFINFLYKFAIEHDIHYFLSGGNFALECILQRGNTCDKYDKKNIMAIHKRFGEGPIDKLEIFTSYKKYIYEYIYKIQTYKPLDYVDYNRDRAFKELEEFCGFKYYGRKHLENYLCSFLQLYWLPNKFKVDKRTSHLSSMIVSGQMTREQALEELKEPLYDEKYMEKVKSLICKNMNMAVEELDRYVAEPGCQHNAYPVDKLQPELRKIYRLFIK